MKQPDFDDPWSALKAAATALIVLGIIVSAVQAVVAFGAAALFTDRIIIPVLLAVAAAAAWEAWHGRVFGAAAFGALAAVGLLMLVPGLPGVLVVVGTIALWLGGHAARGELRPTRSRRPDNRPSMRASRL